MALHIISKFDIAVESIVSAFGRIGREFADVGIEENRVIGYDLRLAVIFGEVITEILG